MDNRPIGMFDSGVGGLTVYKEIRKKFPNENIVYLGDTKSFPYGGKSRESIINLTKNGIDFLVSKNVKAVIIACGTATSQALDVVKDLYSIPIVGIIEPTARYVASKTNLHKIGIVATNGTIRSNAWANNLLKYSKDLEIINKPCPLLAPMAEEGWTDNEIARLAVHEYMDGLHDVDALILGCTHYPLFAELFKKELKPSAEVINTGTIIANNLKYLLGDLLINRDNLEDEKLNAGALNGNQKVGLKIGSSEIFLTDTECNFVSVAEKLLNDKISFNKI